MIDAAMLEQMRAKVDAMPDGSGVDLTPLTTSAELLAFCATTSRAEGWDECDMCELVVRLSPMSPDTVRDAVRVLEPLGYRDVCARLRQTAGRRKHELAPLR